MVRPHAVLLGKLCNSYIPSGSFVALKFSKNLKVINLLNAIRVSTLEYLATGIVPTLTRENRVFDSSFKMFSSCELFSSFSRNTSHVTISTISK